MSYPSVCIWPSSVALRWLEDIMQERFGVKFELEKTSRGICLSVRYLPGAIRQVYFSSWSEFSPEALPCGHWDSGRTDWRAASNKCIPTPGVSSPPANLIWVTEFGYHIDYDILGLTYWMLTRCEEVEHGQSDRYGRFPAQASHAYRHGYLQRPIVDEWLHILRQVIERQWPELVLKPARYSMCVSHDVDEPGRYAFKSWTALLRVVAADLIRHQKWLAPWRGLQARLQSPRKLALSDPANTFSWLMDLSEQYGLKSAFYFICGRTNPAMDADYELEWLAIRNLLREIHGRGHEIGLHPSFETYQHSELIKIESQRLRSVCHEEGIRQKIWGGRMHYLRWSHPQTMRAWEEAGMTYDSTLGYADLPGFRCGTCYEYPAFDPVEGRQLNLRIRPLIAMDVTVMSPNYMGLGQGAKALQQFATLIKVCRSVNGCFTLLWHNSHLSTAGERDLYEQILQLGAAKAE